MKYSGIGGQAVLEGIMMRNGEKYSVAVRRSDGSIASKTDVFHNIGAGNKVINLPFIRGVFRFIDSLRLGISTLTWSASVMEEEEGGEAAGKQVSSGKEKALMGVTVAFSLLIGIAVFILLPMFLSNFLKTVIPSLALLGLIEGVIRVAIFLLYVFAISQMKEIRRTFMYHGAEHKCINCVETGHALTVENVMKSSKEHKRCGTSFLLLVMMISILFFLFIRTDTLWLRMVLRIALLPVIAGVAFEFIQLAGRSTNCVVNVLSRPGMWLQGMTTKQPDEQMAEVAIAAVEEVFDWHAYLDENFPGWEENE